MARIYRTTDIVPIKVDELTVGISPLSFEQKMQVQAELLKGGAQASMRAAKLACQFAIKSVKGIETLDGNEYAVSMENNILSDESWDDLQNIEQTQKIVTVCLALLNGMSDSLTDPETGLKIDGVSFIQEAKPEKKN